MVLFLEKKLTIDIFNEPLVLKFQNTKKLSFFKNIVCFKTIVYKKFTIFFQVMNVYCNVFFIKK